MSEVFFIADLHLGHRNIIYYTSRGHKTIEEHDEAIIAAWNSVVGKRDVVWVLGDVAFGENNLWKLYKANGRKKLVMGNHDTLGAKRYLRVFEDIYGVVNYKHRIVLSHIPLREAQIEHRWKLNIHGHLHDLVIDDDMYLNVSVEQLPEHKPMSLDLVKEILNAR